ncbi:MAG: MATE family efflux transporter, partial [Clostridia bacterium]|nr:MATE family efflux transporter [Clostridia bacterium]
AVAMDMCHGPLFWKIIKYTIPIMLSSILQLLFNAADLIVVGQFCGEISVAAVGATGSLTNLFVNFFIGLSVGAGVTVAQGIGSGDDRKVHDAVHTTIPIALVVGVFLTVFGMVFSKPALRLMGTPDEVIGLSALYMRIYFAGIIAMLLYNFGASILRAAGDTKSPLLFLALAGVLNVVLNCIFVICFHMDVAGVALATTISQCLSALLVILTLLRRKDACKLMVSHMRFYKGALLRILMLGVPAGTQSSLFSISNVIIQSSINSFGSIAMSGSAAAGNIEGFVFVILNAFYQTALNFTGQNYGAGQYKRINKVLGYCLICVAATGFTVGAVAFIFAKPLLSIYIPNAPQAIEYGVIRMTYVCLPYFLCGLMEVTTGVLRGMGRSIISMIISIFGVCGIRIVWIFTVFRFYRTFDCLFLSYPVTWAATFLIQISVYAVICMSRNHKKLEGASL